jgi:hypothetical protein
MMRIAQPGGAGTTAFTYLSTIFVGSIVAANLMGTKVIPFFTIGALSSPDRIGGSSSFPSPFW